MSKVLIVVFFIFGTVVGSGFSSGNEIMIFFSRFGTMSYFYIFLAGVLFFLLFYFFLSHGKRILNVVENSKILNIIIVFISVVFCSSMFAGVENLFLYFPGWLYVVLIIALLIGCIVFTLKGVNGLEKLNLYVMPLTVVCFLIVLIYALSVSSNFSVETNSWAGILYAPLYVALNTSMSGTIIAKVGRTLNKKQTFFASLFSTLLLLLFLFLGNFVLQRNTDSFFSEMPFLFLMKQNKFMFVLIYIVILIGCFTTLISLCLTLKTAFDKIFKNSIFSAILSVGIPFLLSSVGFSRIIQFLYPICSVLGVVILLFLIFYENIDKKT